MRVPSCRLGEDLLQASSIFIPPLGAEKRSFPALPKANLHSDSALPRFSKTQLTPKVEERTDTECIFIFQKNCHVLG